MKHTHTHGISRWRADCVADNKRWHRPSPLVLVKGSGLGLMRAKIWKEAWWISQGTRYMCREKRIQQEGRHARRFLYFHSQCLLRFSKGVQLFHEAYIWKDNTWSFLHPSRLPFHLSQFQKKHELSCNLQRALSSVYRRFTNTSQHTARQPLGVMIPLNGRIMVTLRCKHHSIMKASPMLQAPTVKSLSRVESDGSHDCEEEM